MWLRTTALEKQTSSKCLPLSVLGTVLSAFFTAAPSAAFPPYFTEGDAQVQRSEGNGSNLQSQCVVDIGFKLQV